MSEMGLEVHTDGHRTGTTVFLVDLATGERHSLPGIRGLTIEMPEDDNAEVVLQLRPMPHLAQAAQASRAAREAQAAHQAGTS
jgi:hypothetical protein